MPYYIVNATVSHMGWVQVEAASADEALAEARERDATEFEIDTSTAEVKFNVVWPVVDEVDAARKKKP